MRQGSSRTDCINFWQWQNTYLGIIHKPKAWNIPLRSKNINHLKQNTYSVLVWPRSSGWLRPTVRGQRMANSKLSNSAWFNSVVNQRHTYYSKLCSKILKSNHSLNGKEEIQHWKGFSPSLPPLLLSPVWRLSFHLDLVWSVISISPRRPVALRLKGYVKLLAVYGLLAHNIKQRIEAWASKEKPLKGWRTKWIESVSQLPWRLCVSALTLKKKITKGIHL